MGNQRVTNGRSGRRADRERFKEGATSFGSFYPKNYVLAVFASESAARQAADGARGAGFAEDEVIVASGADVNGEQP